MIELKEFILFGLRLRSLTFRREVHIMYLILGIYTLFCTRHTMNKDQETLKFIFNLSFNKFIHFNVCLLKL